MTLSITNWSSLIILSINTISRTTVVFEDVEILTRRLTSNRKATWHWFYSRNISSSCAAFSTIFWWELCPVDGLMLVMTRQRIRLLQITEHCIGGSLMAKAASDQNTKQIQLGWLEMWWRLKYIFGKGIHWTGNLLGYWRKKWKLRGGFYKEGNAFPGVRSTHQTSWTKQHRCRIWQFSILHFQFFIFSATIQF